MTDTGEIFFPYDFEDLDPDELREIMDYSNGCRGKFIHIGPKKFFLTGSYTAEAANIYNFPLRSDDTFVVTFPKSGTTMTQELIWQIANNFDYEKAKSIKIFDRFPFLEAETFLNELIPELTEVQKLQMTEKVLPPSIKEITKMPSPRFIKSHLPLSLLPPSLLDTSKVVYVARDPRDVAVSYYHHNLLMKSMTPDREFKPFWNFFITGKVLWAPYYEHILEAWEKRNHPNMLFLFYEELTKDLPDCIRRVAKFFGKTISEEEVDSLCQHLKFDNFKKNKSVNMQVMQEIGFLTKDGAFVRKGKVGGWREYFDEEMTKQAEEWMASHTRNTDFRFPN